MDVWLSSHGHKTRYVLGDARLSINERVIELSTIARVRLVVLAEMQACELTLRDGKTAMVVNDTKEHSASYGELVRALHGRLAPLPGVEFVRGSWLLVGVLAAIGVVVIAFAVVLQQGWFSVPPMFAGKATLIMILGFAWIVLGPLLVWKSRPRGYDPRSPPAELLA